MKKTIDIKFTGRCLTAKRARELEEVERLAIALCNASNETEQNGYRRQLGILLCGWPK